MTYELRDYQRAASDRAVEFFTDKKRKGNAIMVLPTGSGKSLIIADIASRLSEPTLVFQPSKEILEQNFQKLTSYGILDCAVYSASMNSKNIARITFATIGSVINNKEQFAHFRYIIVDECFTGETEILTELGFVKFSDLNKGVKVAQWDNGKIDFTYPVRYINRPHNGSITLFNIKNGISVPMTNNHQQIFTTRKKRGVFFKESISKARFSGRLIPVSGFYRCEDNEILTPIERLFIATQADGSIHKAYNKYTTISFSLKKERKIIRLLSLCKEAGTEVSEVKTKGTHRRFMVKMPAGTTKLIQNHLKFPMSTNKALQILDECVLWDGHKPSNKERLYYFSSTDKHAIDFYNAVASISGNSAYVSVQKDDRSDKFRDVYRLFISLNKTLRDCQCVSTSSSFYKGNVYCVEVPSGAIIVRHNGYTFVSGNCHFVNAKQGMYFDFLEQMNVPVLGLTATPYRLSSNSFGSILKFITRTKPRVFKEVIYHCQVGELAQRGYLAKLEYYRVKSIESRNLQLNSTRADYTDKSVKAEYQRSNFQNKILEIVERLIRAGRENILVFTRFVEEAQFIVDNLDGLAEIVTAQTPKKERERILKDFKSGEIRVIANVSVLSVGFDFPELSTIVLARPTMSLALYYQMVGRGIRPHSTKKCSWIVDLCENYERFGEVEKLVLSKDSKGLWGVFSGEKQLTNVFF